MLVYLPLHITPVAPLTTSAAAVAAAADVETNTTAISHHSKYNEDGYVFTAAVGRTYWLHWDIPYRVDSAR